MRFLVLLLCLSNASAQLTTGALEGRAEAAAATTVEIVGAPGRHLQLTTDSEGRFAAVLPYGIYIVRSDTLVAACRVRIVPLETARCTLRPGEGITGNAPGVPAPGANNAAQALLLGAPGVVTWPLDFAGLGNIRRPILAGPATSDWTATTFRLNGLDATDSYQPGLPVMLDDAAAIDSVLARDLDTTGAALFLRVPDRVWHFGLATQDTGASIGGGAQGFRWFTRDTAEADAVLGQWADIAATATGQWGSQATPEIRTRLLFANIRGQARLSSRDRIDALYSGSRNDLSNFGWPAGIEPILASPLLPSFYAIDGFLNLREVDHFDLAQAGWLHQFAPARVLEVRYGYSTSHQDTVATAPTDSPLTNFAIRTRHEIAAVYQLHHFTATADFETSQPRNRYQTPLGADTAVLQLNTPSDTRTRIDTFNPSAREAIRLRGGLALDLGFVLDVAHAQSISWNSPSPRLGVALPLLHRVTLRAAYSLTYARLAGRYLDFGNPTSLSGQIFDPQSGQLLERFGGAWSSIDPHLRRPRAGEYRLAMELNLPYRSAFMLDLSRRDQTRRIAAIDTGVPAVDYFPVVIRDPGPDFLPGTFDDQLITVYAQNPATLGHDRYLLTNPAGLRELSEALTATLRTHLPATEIRASFVAEKSFGPTNPGNSPWTNDPGVIGALYTNPNTLINATGHPFLDRAFTGKFQTLTQTPAWLGAIRIANAINYLDGLPFARQLLVTGLPQGPFYIDATIRGSPEGGNRAQYVLNWNLRAERSFGRLTLAADLLNVLNNRNTIVQNDLSGPQFNQRLPLALPPSRMLRLSARWRF